jgi:NAD(P)-dependent dehydrogenase (short-subunit alcohol dehydrogenase family)
MKKIAIVTGANSGLGFETTKALSSQDYTIIMACRNLEKAENAKATILATNPNAILEILHLDLGDLDSIKNFASLFSEKYKQIDLLINNAGLAANKGSVTKDKIEKSFGTNYIGHFHLTNLLFPIVSNTKNSRIVSLASLAHRMIKKPFISKDTVNALHGFEAYSYSKMACLVFAYELQRRLEKSKRSTISVVAHPGVSITNISKGLPKIVLSAQEKFGALFMSNQKNGAEATLYAATQENVKGGDYYGPGGLFEIKGKVKKVDSNKLSKDEEFAKNLWHLAEEMTGSEFGV